MKISDLPEGTLLIDKVSRKKYLLCLKQGKKITWLSSGRVSLVDYEGKKAKRTVLNDEDFEVFYPESTA